MSKNNQQNGKQVQPAAQPRLTGALAIQSHRAEARKGGVPTVGSPQCGDNMIPPCEISGATQEDLDRIKRKALPQPPIPVSVPVEQPEPASPTTIKLKGLTKTRLDTLKGIMKIDDYDGVVNRLIDNLPAKLSTETEVHLVMPISKYRWLLAKQDTCDCRTCLNDSRV